MAPNHKPAAGRKQPKMASKRQAEVKSTFTLDADSRSDIYGIVMCASAIALLIALLAEGTGIVGKYISQAMLLGFGDGAYVWPVLLLFWGITFFIKSFSVAKLRIGIGLLVLFLALISLISLSAPSATFWSHETLSAYGGYLGASISWSFTNLVGTAISYVLLSALLLVGLVITGLSITKALDWVMGIYRSKIPEDDTPNRSRLPRDKTVRLKESSADRETQSELADSKAISESRNGFEDPERRRKTIPSPRIAAPRAMEGFELPPFKILARTSETASHHRSSEREMTATAALIEETLATFDIPVKVVHWVAGPTVTMFELELPKGLKVNRITTLADDIALSLAASTVRILAPIPGKSRVGIEVPNVRRSTVTLGDVLCSAPSTSSSPLLLGVGKDVSGEAVLADLATMPHLLIAGSTGTGKSVCINALLSGILMRATPSECRLILIDPKRIELSLYNGIPHLYVPVVTEAKESASALAWSVQEMERRLKLLQAAGARNIGMYNAMLHDNKLQEDAEEMPYIVIVIDELADLMMVAAKEVEDSICRLAQLARAAGIHLIVATQRPSTDIITGLIKTNITNRIAFAVGSSIDSRVILDQPGAEKLVGLGDMLFSVPAWPKPKRIQGAYISEDEILQMVEHLKSQAEPEYRDEILRVKVSAQGGGIDSSGDEDPLLWEAADIVVTSGMGSTSLLQRRLKVGYARAGRIMDMLEARGIVGLPDGSRPREVLVDVEGLEAVRAFEHHDATQGER
ncbi:MAG: DNA translocase FtsK 4TM domain-containing protein [Actinobacteria bacterium]|nr:DNA translocase FtsK 4TM domain-containing protein [Actinomycetota bacterium]